MFERTFLATIPWEKVYHEGGLGGDHSIIAHRCAEVLLVELGLFDRSGGALDAEADEVGGGDGAGAHRAGADLRPRPLSLLALRA